MTHRGDPALELDDAIDRLIHAPEQPHDVDEGELVATARVLQRTLPRFHPRFTFEEHLAQRLAVLRRTVAVRPVEAPIPLPTATPIGAADPTTASAHAASTEAAERRRRSLVAGGAIASGVSLAIPIAGAAIVVWRRSRSSGGLL